MKTTLQISLATVAALTFAANAGAWSDGFEAYAAGSSVAGQGGWQGWTGNAAVAGLVSTAQAASGTKSLQILSANDTVQPFTGLSSGLWTLSMQQYIPSTSSGTTYTILLNRYPANLNWSSQVTADIGAGLVGYFDGAGNQQGSTLALNKDKWVDLRFDINLTANSVSAYYDNALMATTAWQSGGINQLQALDLYGDETGATTQVGPVYYDNIMLVQVPEPTSLSLLVLGGLALAFRRKLA